MKRCVIFDQGVALEHQEMATRPLDLPLSWSQAGRSVGPEMTPRGQESKEKLVLEEGTGIPHQTQGEPLDSPIHLLPLMLCPSLRLEGAPPSTLAVASTMKSSVPQLYVPRSWVEDRFRQVSSSQHLLVCPSCLA